MAEKRILSRQKPVDISAFQHLYPFKSHFFDLDGLKYHYLDQGRGDPVVMIHGNPTWSFYFRSLIKGLPSQFRAIVPDHIGCGLSDKPDANQYRFRLKNRVEDLETFLNYLDLKKRITLICHDWGGMIGMIYALRNIEKIERIVLMNTAAFFPPGNKKLPFRLWFIRHVTPFSKLAVQGANLFAYAALFMASRKKLDNDVRSGLIAPYNCWTNRTAILKFVQDIPVNKEDPSYDLVEYADKNLYKLGNIPMLMCWGKHDFVFDMAYLSEWQRRFPDATVHLFPDAGHYVLEDEPEKILLLVKNFLKS